MTNHIHLIAFPHHQDSLAQTLAAAPTRYSQLINRRTRKGGHLWQGRFFSCPLDDDYLIRAARYIELNPEWAGLVAKAARPKRLPLHSITNATIITCLLQAHLPYISPDAKSRISMRGLNMRLLSSIFARSPSKKIMAS
jgi:hypothetical protein